MRTWLLPLSTCLLLGAAKADVPPETPVSPLLSQTSGFSSWAYADFLGGSITANPLTPGGEAYMLYSRETRGNDTQIDPYGSGPEAFSFSVGLSAIGQSGNAILTGHGVKDDGGFRAVDSGFVDHWDLTPKSALDFEMMVATGVGGQATASVTIETWMRLGDGSRIDRSQTVNLASTGGAPSCRTSQLSVRLENTLSEWADWGYRMVYTTVAGVVPGD